MAPSSNKTLNLSQLENSDRVTQFNIYITIPEKYHQEPIVSQLASRYNLDINILAATLGAGGRGNGWFHLSLSGSSQSIKDALIYLEELDITLLNDLEMDGW